MMKKHKIKIIASSLFALFFYCFIFLAPINISTSFQLSSSFSTGFFSPYSSFSLYAADIFFILSMIFVVGNVKLIFSNKLLLRIFSLFLALAMLSAIFASNSVLSFLLILRFLQFFLVCLVIQSGVLKRDKLITVFLASIFFLSVIAILQFIFQSSLSLQIFGEPLLSSDSLGVAKFLLFDETFIRAYSLTLHPNILGGFVVAALFLLQSRYLKFSKLKYWFFVLILLFALFSTFSRSAILALFLASLFLSADRVKFKILISFVFFLFVLFSLFVFRSGLSERLDLLLIAKDAFLSSPLSGIGLGNFTLVMQKFSSVELMPWEFQPVHNVFVLMLCELGIGALGLFACLFCGVFESLKKSKISCVLILSIFIISLFDHYLVTLYPGMFLSSFVLGLVLSE